jgi:stage II sporulation protein D
MDTWLQNAVTDTAGSVETVEVGGVSVKGSTVRGILGLRSACFEWEVQEQMLVFYVTGFGHGVGMSQYGANQMAADGADYREILTHYYTGVTVEPYVPGEG